MAGSISRRRALGRSATAALAIGLIWVGCTQDRGDLTGPGDQAPPFQDLFASAIAAQNRHTDQLISVPEVVGTAVGLGEDGRPAVKIFTTRAGVTGLPAQLEGIPVEVEVTGMFVALTDPTANQPRPVPTGVSTGHPNITAGTIGARVKDGSGNVYALSNNHVYADANDANIGDGVIQPGAFDGGSDPADRIGTLFDFEPIDFSASGSNVIDAAIALSSVTDLGYSTPADDGYGAPGTSLAAAYVGQPVMKYGRTTGLTQGTVSEINVQVTVCYEVYLIFCIKSAFFYDQIGISPGDFSGGGDSGSLIVTDDGIKKPVGLLFAGSSTRTLANPIGEVLARFGVTIDGGDGDPPPPPPPPPATTTDIAITDVSGPASVTEGDGANVDVTVSNAGTENVTNDIVVTLTDDTDATTIGMQTISGGLNYGASTTLNFSWNTTGASTGDHTLMASHDFSDDDSGNDWKSTAVTVEAPSPPPAATMHVGDLDATTSNEGSSWSAYVILRLHDIQENPVQGATVYARWRGGGLGSDECVTDYAGECLFLNTLIPKRRKKVAFTATGADNGVMTYVAESNHDPDGDSNGTKITANRP